MIPFVRSKTSSFYLQYQDQPQNLYGLSSSSAHIECGIVSLSVCQRKNFYYPVENLLHLFHCPEYPFDWPSNGWAGQATTHGHHIRYIPAAGAWSFMNLLISMERLAEVYTWGGRSC